MQILHFEWLRYQRTVSPQVAIERDAFFRVIPKEIFFNFPLLTLFWAFSVQLVE